MYAHMYILMYVRTLSFYMYFTCICTCILNSCFCLFCTYVTRYLNIFLEFSCNFWYIVINNTNFNIILKVMFLSCIILNTQNQYLFVYSTAIFNTFIQIPFVKLLFILHPIYSNFAIFCTEKKKTHTLLKVLNAYYNSLKIGKNVDKSYCNNLFNSII